MGLDCRHCRHRSGRIPGHRRLERQQQYGEQYITGCDEPLEYNRQRIAAYGPAHDYRLGRDFAAADDTRNAGHTATAKERYAVNQQVRFC
jgi:hypothetical protein